MIIVKYSRKFERQYKKLPEDVKDLVEKRMEIFSTDPFDQRLKTHKLSGSLEDHWAFWIDRKYRIIFFFEEKNTVEFHTIGNHSIYNQR